MRRVLWGIALSTVTLNFWYWDVILPAIGVALSWIGYRMLRRENGCFKVCWTISIFSMAAQAVDLILNATLFNLNETQVWPFVVAVGLAADLVQIFCLWRGIKVVRRKAGQPDEAKAAGALVLWYIVLVSVVTFGLENSLFAWPLLLAYACILFSLFKIPALLDEAGYEVESAPIQLSEIPAMVLWIVLLTGGCLWPGCCTADIPWNGRLFQPMNTRDWRRLRLICWNWGCPRRPVC